MADSVSTQIVQESPLLEAQKLQLLADARKQVEQAGLAAQQGIFLNPDYRIAGMSPDQRAAIEAGRAGIGAYQPFLSRATQTQMDALGTTQSALQGLQGADTRGYFPGAQMALGAAGIPIGRMEEAARMTRNTQLGPAPTVGYQPNLQTYQMGPAERVQTQSFAQPGSAEAFMSPYMQNVVDIQQREAQRQADIAATSRGQKYARAGAFGGARQAIENAEAARNLAMQKGDIQAQGLQGAYQQAQQQFNQEQQARLAAQQANQQAGLAVGQQNLASQLGVQQLGAQQGLQAALADQAMRGQYGIAGTQMGLQAGQQLANIYGQQSQLGQQLAQGIGSLAGQEFGIGQQLAQTTGQLGAQQGALGSQIAGLGAQSQAMGQQDVNFLYNLGAQQQRQSQAQLDAERQNLLQKNMQPYQQIGFLSDIYKNAPTSQMAMSQQSQAAPSPFQQIAGLGVAGVSAAAAGAKAGLF